MTVLVVGAGGFVGSYLVEALKNHDKNSKIAATKLESERVDIDGVEMTDLDIRDEQAVTKLLDDVRPDRIYHLAGQSSARLSWEKPALTFQVNTIGSINLLEAARRMDKQPRILMIGSGEEYGTGLPSVAPIRETATPRPANPYAVSKLAQSILGSIYYSAYGIPVISARSFNHIGPGQSDTFVASDFCRQVAEIEAGLRSDKISVGNLSAVRDFTDVRDVTQAYVLLMEKGVAGRIYNVGGGKVCSIKELLDTILDLSTMKIRVTEDKQRLRPLDIPHISADISQLRKDTGFTPQYSLAETLESTLEYWRQKINSINTNSINSAGETL